MTERNKPIDKYFQYYLDHQDEFVEKYNGKVLLMIDYKVVKTFDTEKEAHEYSEKYYKSKMCLVQKCSPGDEDTTYSVTRWLFIDFSKASKEIRDRYSSPKEWKNN